MVETSDAKNRARRSSGRPTLADVARRAGVGTITVSRALRDPKRVSVERRDRIFTAIDDLGYVLNPNASALASARAAVIGVLVPSLTNNVFAEVLRGIHDGLRDSRLQIQFANTHYSDVEEERLLRVFLSQHPSGLIVSGIDQTPATRTLLEKAGCPVVQIMEIGPDPVDMMVGFSHFEGGRTVTQHLVDAGCRRIGFLGARMDPRSHRRLSGYKAVMEAAGCFDPAFITTTTLPSSVSIGGDLFRMAYAKTPNIDALVCNNDDLAMGVLFACQRASLPVPARISLAGFNDLEMMAVAFPSITSIRTPRFEIGRQAIAMVQAALAGERPANAIVDLGFELKIRESTTRSNILNR
ncbi:LacI family gluconate utilization system Gnt-I transcriptional repressor [Pararhizobium capsulatum DSM 1112]|uniref:LacI family gluconate utilization system Gnt-I transcriptional repressor n=1 Tax=Pararhizobium capsulatum DSM 1112 TaxID=1121113 RepID=A0ABU0BV26_9HYPH|nr:LacI family DNA-binding transcriptional regulator [Pararhizobium capsulatum]MDQ0322106.1 LacI family gluconate utilization system Gnt-I transcriptional repressor [Pararhizobium capsulatum DSM 1112]